MAYDNVCVPTNKGHDYDYVKGCTSIGTLQALGNPPISLRGEVLALKTFVVVHVPNQKSKLAYLCLLDVSILSLH